MMGCGGLPARRSPQVSLWLWFTRGEGWRGARSGYNRQGRGRLASGAAYPTQ